MNNDDLTARALQAARLAEASGFKNTADALYNLALISARENREVSNCICVDIATPDIVIHRR